jgi:hypothetical protein
LSVFASRAAKALGVSAIAEFSAIRPSLWPFDSLAMNPLKNVWGAIPQFDLPVLTLAQETNRLKVDEVNLRHVENHRCGVNENMPAELFDAIGTDPADETQDESRTVPFCFNSEHGDARCFSGKRVPVQLWGL